MDIFILNTIVFWIILLMVCQQILEKTTFGKDLKCCTHSMHSSEMSPFEINSFLLTIFAKKIV
jgi:ribose/xylose/arabinose/galactoside ABC-type transport system permease subunit